MAQIKKDTSLRKAILQAAITGQLISSCHSELDSESTETGKELLDRIIEERNNKLLAEWEEAKKTNPKAKKPTPVVASEIDEEEEIPFEIPENWCWCRLGDVAFLSSGSPYKETENGLWFVKVADMNLEENSKEIIISTRKASYCEKPIIPINSIIFPKRGGAILTNKKRMVLKHPILIDSNTMAISVYEDNIFQYLNIWFQNIDLGKMASGTSVPQINNKDIEPLLFPLPPLAVQNAIVEKLEQVLPLVDAYENALLQKEELKSALPDKVKKAILQEAITGQLTEAWRKSATIKESGKQLLDRIIEERNAKALAEWEEALKKNPKAKKPVSVVASEIEEDEIPFEVPESWCWVRGENIFAPMESIKPQGETFTYIDTDAVNNKLNIIDNQKKLLVKEAPSRASRKLHKGDVLFSMVRPYLKNIAFVEDCFVDAIASTGFYVMTQIGMYNPKYLYYMVLSPYVIDGLHYFMKGDNSPSINTTDIDNFVYPLPPLEEQKEIVKKVEELLPLCK